VVYGYNASGYKPAIQRATSTAGTTYSGQNSLDTTLGSNNLYQICTLPLASGIMCTVYDNMVALHLKKCGPAVSTFDAARTDVSMALRTNYSWSAISNAVDTVYLVWVEGTGVNGIIYLATWSPTGGLTTPVVVQSGVAADFVNVTVDLTRVNGSRNGVVVSWIAGQYVYCKTVDQFGVMNGPQVVCDEGAGATLLDCATQQTLTAGVLIVAFGRGTANPISLRAVLFTPTWGVPVASARHVSPSGAMYDNGISV
jgi:hypothetical protein